MGRFIVGQVVSCSFPFSDLSTNKRRPAVIVAIVDFADLILCQITSKSYSSSRAIGLTSGDFKTGHLPRDSFIRPDKLFTADQGVVINVLGVLDDEKLRTLKKSLRNLFE